MQERHQIGLELGQLINQAERQTDQALASAGEMLAKLGAVRRSGRIAASSSQAAVMQVAEAVKLLGSARGAFVRAHEEMQRTAADGDMDPYTGDTNKPRDPPTGSVSTIREVA